MNKFKLTLAALCLALGASSFAERAPEYISPNNDGVQDTLVIPLKIKEKRYIKEWKLIIYNENGDVVRTIGNKRKDEEKLTFTTFFKKLFNPKSGVDIPSSIVWNGRLGDEASALGLVPGDVAPDGKYYYIFRATDDNDNTGVSARYYVIVDCTAPVITLETMTDDEKSFGEGTKPSVKIKQTGSEEVLWSGAVIYSADGKKVKTYKWENSSPAPEVIWDGTADNGSLVKDGVYHYEIFATDKAGNTSEKAVVTNIIFSAEKPVIAISLKDGKYFSPNGDGVKDLMYFDIKLPLAPSAVNTLSEWKLSIFDSNGKLCVEKSGDGSAVPEDYFDGKKKDGTLLKDGIYRAVLSARYKNGYVPPLSESPDFILDVTAPAANVTASDRIFNGEKNLTLTQKQISAEPPFADGKTWTGEIKSADDGTVVRTFSFGSKLSDSLAWNGTDSHGHFVSDGDYIYELKGVDAAGNVGSAKSEKFTLDSSKTELNMSASCEAFSSEPIEFYPSVKAASGISSYEFTVTDAQGKEVFVIKGTGNVPDTIPWDGKTTDGSIAPDGKYGAKISTAANNSNVATSKLISFIKDTQVPEIKISSPYTVFSPDGLQVSVSPRQVLPVKIEKSSEEDSWTVEIRDASGKVVRTIIQSASGKKISASDFDWDAKDDNGNKVADGKYSLAVYSVDVAGNRGEDKILNITVDKRETGAYVTAADELISPNGDGFKEEEVLSVKTLLNDGIKNWAFNVIAKDGSSVKSWNGGENTRVPESFVWNGKDSEGNDCEGQYYGKITIDYAKGNHVESQSTPFVVTSTAPILSVISSANPDEFEYFSPDNDGYEDELDMLLYAKTLAGVKSWSLVVKDSHNKSKTFWMTSGKSMPADSSGENLYRASINWDGRGNDGEIVMSAEDYPYEFTVTDNLGMTSVYKGIIPVDVLLVDDNGRLKMQVPSIIFRGDAADFKLTGETDDKGKVIARSSLTQAQRDNNVRVLKRVAQVLNKFSGYKVTVVGHANPMEDYNGPEENNPEEVQLKELSLQRAQFVKKWLVENGKISEARLSTEGKGGLETIANRKDTATNWKNRRVEFILEK